MSLEDFRCYERISTLEAPNFATFIMGALSTADSTEHLSVLVQAFPEIWAEFSIRYNAPWGTIDISELRKESVDRGLALSKEDESAALEKIVEARELAEQSTGDLFSEPPPEFNPKPEKSSAETLAEDMQTMSEWMKEDKAEDFVGDLIDIVKEDNE
ncbi:MAG: hypothetical protein JSW58_08610 [Candidatus Latescibacterota bacterium]|nr:MAG: hypothetical protein JSW58_08610 [Candidatus Latescibacterota bacterium]